jgi:hypothetical protein
MSHSDMHTVMSDRFPQLGNSSMRGGEIFMETDPQSFRFFDYGYLSSTIKNASGVVIASVWFS